MPRFYFNISNSSLLDDEVGMELPDPGAVWQHAHAVGSELTYHCDGMLGLPWCEWTMTVTNDQGEKVLSFRLADPKDEGTP